MEYELGDFETCDGKFNNGLYLQVLWMSYFVRIAIILLGIILGCGVYFLMYEPAKMPSYLWIVFLVDFGVCIWGSQKPIMQKAIDFHKRLRKVPKIIKINAKKMYGNQWRPAALECDEAHIGGDCPLCGAE
jgi:hypothetical protein